MLDVSIVIPTFREAENLKELLPTITSVLAEAGLRGEMIVVDDNSGDGTTELIAAMDDPQVRLIVRTEERGLSSAVLHGLRHASGEVLLVMDADLSHPPEKIPELVAALKTSDPNSPPAEFAIGSRYVEGGELDESWGLFRWLNSRASTWLARPLTSARDPMAGFFAIRRNRFLSAAPLNPIGYKIGLELIVKCGCRNIVEIPITFRDRVHGASKLNFREQCNYLRHLARLYEFRLGAFARLFKFILVGASGMVVDLIAFTCLMGLVGFGRARALAIWLAMTWNYLLNRRITFTDAKAANPLYQYIMFCLACLLGGVINWTVSYTLFHYAMWFPRSEVLAALAGIIAGTTSNFLLSDRWVFRRESPQAESPGDE